MPLIPVELIRDPPMPVRATPASAEADAELLNSIGALGLLEPILVRPARSKLATNAAQQRVVRRRAGCLRRHCGGGRPQRSHNHGRRDVLWRHVDAEWCDPLELNAASRIGVPGLIDAIRSGGVARGGMR